MSVASRVRSGFVGAAVVLLATLGFAAPAAAHDALDGSDPVTGASVEVAPAQITLTFTADLMPDGAEAQVFASTDPVAASQAQETDWSAGDVVVDGASLIIPLQEGLPAGTYSVNWRVVSSDGHAISTSSADIITFTVTTGAVDAVETPAVTPSATPTPQETTKPSPTATPDAPAPADELPGLSPIVIGALVVGGVIVLALLYIIIRVIRRP